MKTFWAGIGDNKSLIWVIVSLMIRQNECETKLIKSVLLISETCLNAFISSNKEYNYLILEMLTYIEVILFQAKYGIMTL